MKTELKVKLLQFLLGKKKDQNEGFTLIELLVVVIIIGVLAAIALPNLLGQVGKARESEAKNIIGALNRAQQAHFTEKGTFAAAKADLEVPTGGENYYTFDVKAAGVQFADGNDNAANGTRDYSGGVAYNTTTRVFSSVICRAKTSPAYDLAPDAADAPTAGAGVGITAACKGTNDEQVK